MKVLYAVQGTGNGHITRARVMARNFKALGIKVDWIFSGRDPDDYFDMEKFGDYQTYQGLTFAIKNGRIQNFKTLLKNNIFKFIRDIFSVRFDGYDLVINDFEPVTAWAAKLRGKKIVGLSHQMAFQRKIPVAGANPLARLVLKFFAPVHLPVGLHWDDFGQSLLPPIVPPTQAPQRLNKNSILVYYPFVSSDALISWFKDFPEYEFHIFHGTEIYSGYDHIQIYPFSRINFREKQNHCSGVITAAGFELPSEAIQFGHKLLVLPIEKQMEQQSNALALSTIGRATVIHDMNKEALSQWLKHPVHEPKQFPNVAFEVAKWLVNSERGSLENLSKKLWDQYKNPATEQSLSTIR